MSERRPLRVGLVYASDFEAVSPGGIAGSIEETVAALGEAVEFVAVAVGRRGEERETLRVGGRRLPLIPVMTAPRRMPWLPLNVVFTARLLMRRRAILRRVDLLHAHRMELAIPFLIGKRRPVLLTIHGASKHHAFCSTGWLRWRLVRAAYDAAERWVLARVDRVICVSEDALAFYRRRFPRLAAKFVRIPNALPPDDAAPAERAAARAAFGLREDQIAVVYAGRLGAEKRVDRLVEAFAEVVREAPEAVLLIAGDGPQRAAIADLIVRRRVPGVRVLGLLPRAEVRRLLAAADVMALPSLFEGFPMAVLEALSAGVPVVATPVGAVPEMLSDGLRELVLPEASPRVLKEKILAAARRRPHLREACLRAAARFRPEAVFPQLERVYRTLAPAR